MYTTVNNSNGQEICQAVFISETKASVKTILGKNRTHIEVFIHKPKEIQGFTWLRSNLALAGLYPILENLRYTQAERLQKFYEIYDMSTIEVTQCIDPYGEGTTQKVFYKITFINKLGRGLTGQDRTEMERVLQAAFFMDNTLDLCLVGAADTDSLGSSMSIIIGKLR